MSGHDCPLNSSSLLDLSDHESWKINLQPILQRDVILKLFIVLFPVTALLFACQTTPTSPFIADQGAEFVLAPGESATIKDTGLTIKLISILGDDRCPSEVECAASGPMQLSLAAQKDNGTAKDLMMQTFTDNDGRSPEMEFEGINDRIVY